MARQSRAWALFGTADEPPMTSSREEREKRTGKSKCSDRREDLSTGHSYKLQVQWAVRRQDPQRLVPDVGQPIAYHVNRHTSVELQAEEETIEGGQFAQH